MARMGCQGLFRRRQVECVYCPRQVYGKAYYKVFLPLSCVCAVGGVCGVVPPFGRCRGVPRCSSLAGGGASLLRINKLMNEALVWASEELFAGRELFAGLYLQALGGSLGVYRRGWCVPWVGGWVWVWLILSVILWG